MAEPKGHDDKITITRAELDAAIKAATEAGAKSAAVDVERLISVGVQTALEMQSRKEGTTTQLATQEERFARETGMPVPDRTPPREFLRPCHNKRNGAKFLAKVVPSRTFHAGRVVDLKDYKYPADIGERAKGIVVRKPGAGLVDPSVPGPFGLTREFLDWRLNNYDKPDRIAFVGFSADDVPRELDEKGNPLPDIPVEHGEVRRVAGGL